MTKDIFRIALVGCGPRGLSVLERLRTNFKEDSYAGKIEIYMIDPFLPGSGEVWRTNQSKTLLMNTVASQITLFTDFSVECEGPIMQGPCLYEWAKSLTKIANANLEYSELVMREAEELQPDSYPTRAFYGHYLEWVFKEVVLTMPSNVMVYTHQTRAIAIDDAYDGSQIVQLEKDNVHLRVDAVVLAQGHTPVSLSPEEEKLRKIAAEKGMIYITPSNPADVSLECIKAGEPVILKGLGLNFFDYMSLFTQGRGGQFIRTGNKLVYQASGEEPIIYAGSRRGIPYHARGENEKGASGRHTPIYITPEVIKNFHNQTLDGQAVDFKNDVWPLIAKEIETIYYKVIIEEKSGLNAGQEFQAKYSLYSYGSEHERSILKDFGIPDDLMWDWETLANPVKNHFYDNPEEFNDWLIHYLSLDLKEAKRGNVTSPLKSALDALRDLRNEIRLIVDYAGINGDSYKIELKNWYTPLNAFFSIGPPAIRIEQMIALMEAGIVNIIGPKLKVEVVEEESIFYAVSPFVNNSGIKAKALIEARLPETNLKRNADPLMSYLLKTNQCQTYKIPSCNGLIYDTGGLAVSRPLNKVLDGEGKEHSRRFAFGVPTEGVHWVTAAGIRPGVNSVTLCESDAIAREIISLLHAEHENKEKEMRKILVRA